jgi:molybdopterin converting factor small subunit
VTNLSDSAVEVDVLLFANAAEVAATRRLSVVGSTVAEVLEAVVERIPALAPIVASSGCWVNRIPAQLATPIVAGDEVAIIPPVSGG